MLIISGEVEEKALGVSVSLEPEGKATSELVRGYDSCRSRGIFWKLERFGRFSHDSWRGEAHDKQWWEHRNGDLVGEAIVIPNLRGLEIKGLRGKDTQCLTVS